ncbi:MULTISPECIES: D-alanyl-D-alanine carboxypeptidase/D-alanyl-D-alanine endopeptidase [unclassified Arthrobacter]|uniref:D-alanyl-D-alanine carboxypeptidase/D-alanyl-D-alanine endopeptidase n=1 Tax=unclassified Arthrobacter TaxID=235627 RepID=UPI001D15A7E8|nr:MULTISPECIES: D-alanyl-D-alanine carboxypeptidase/D-alanyl-D-alanine-endopeptidase [unclassified Arthrobacter]MCC3275798.1 D-alanyl-D-alanine carboxypeptidase/D-alanyl-D-alanine-endopeptidase [Arthrobacter sp. zg-Y20]MCC9177151.1 D-alanyl-D-alanine carboxypeptidase/D-alanyl-D-alanine-endopeptidase [Arthrobacter sp. zg-Y750]MDK1315955.1 D-alanyl-D-alanine carboxypeptidase/D-alanyl-D-alanine-endopeptidase [Arthrobacter sp. zg.Y20]WIB06268.1 D-alanyl-D-alanine carboxypeptidase/D-alanyl-D-alanin
MSRVFSGALLALAFAVLLVPLACYVLPPVAESMAGSGVERAEAVPDYQEPPSELEGTGPVSAPRPEDPMPDAVRLGQLLDEELSIEGSGSFHAVVSDALTGTVLYERGGSTGLAPASNLKVLTAAAALSAMDADTRFATTVLAGEEPGTVVLRGGGDVLLTAGASSPDTVAGRAGLATLAQRTAAALTADGTGSPVRVRVDDTLFTGPALSDAWGAADVEAGEIAPVHALAVSSAWAEEGTGPGPRVDDAALAAAQSYRDALAEALAPAGIDVEPVAERGTAPADAAALAEVRSAPLAEQVDYMLLNSDNYLAEALARLTASATGRDASFAGGIEAVQAEIAELGVDTSAMVLGDTNGLSAETSVSAAQLTSLMRILLTTSDPDLRSVAGGLPVAALSGTLAGRYDEAADSGAAGIVRAKTGTLLAVTALSGYATDADGRVLVFTFVATGLDGNTMAARDAVDAAAAVLAGCGCR